MARRISFEVEDSAEAVNQQASRAPSLSGMARSLQAAAATTIREIPVELIEASSLRDRLEIGEDELEDLTHSIREQGQLIPILVSPLPQGRYRIVYGRRRLEALRRLGISAKALVRDLSDSEAIIAQGQENSFRKDLSWIEKASFARELMDDGRADELICDALNIDQKARRNGDKLTGLSRMRQVTARLEAGLIEAVGPAPAVGRDRWYNLSVKIERQNLGPEAQANFTAEIISARETGTTDSNARFDLLEKMVQRPRKTVSCELSSTEQITDHRNSRASVKADSRNASITVKAVDASDLHQWIRNNPEAALKALEEACATATQNQTGSAM